MKRYGGYLDLIFDTQSVLWLAIDNKRLSRTVADTMLDPDTRLFMSAIAAWEYCDLHQRGRLPESVALELIQERIPFIELDLPFSAWKRAISLPDIHRDPVDRLLIAHAIDAGLTLVTADEKMRRYPVKTLW